MLRIAICLLLVSLSIQALAKPNIILIMADDIGYECYGCYGSKQYKTPNIDRLASQGMRFEHCYSQPLCTPSRVKIMTGKSNVRNYSAFSILNRDQQTFGHYLKRAGYKTFVGGKWQLFGAEHYSKQFRGKGSLPEATGFDEHCLWQVDRLGKRFWNPLLCIDGENQQFDEDDYGPDIVTQHILNFIDQNRGGPFFVYYPMILVHNPFLTTPASDARTSKDKQRNFEDMVQYMDKQVGHIADYVDKLGIADETLILVTGDNGTNKAIESRLGDRVIRGGKGKTTDAGTRVAFVAYQPGTVPSGIVSQDLIDFSDFVPTFQDLAGAAIPEGLDGVSFAKQLHGKPGKPREWIYCYYNPRPERTKPARFVRDQRWKLYGDGRFYDVSKDPDENSPIVEQTESRKRLSKALASMPAEGRTLLQFTAKSNASKAPLRPHPQAVPNSHKPGEVDNPDLVPFIVKHPVELPGIVIDETEARLEGEWQYSTHTPPYVGLGYLHDRKKGKGTSSVTFTPKFPLAGMYEVRLSHCYNIRRSTNTPVTIHHADGETKLRINQQDTPEHRRLFRTLGKYRFEKGEKGWVRISTEGTEGKYVIADAVQFLPLSTSKN